MNSKELIELLKADGWREEQQEAASHIRYAHPVKKGKITVAFREESDIPEGTLNALLRQAGLSDLPGTLNMQSSDL